MQFTVEDTGIGIAPEHHESIFQEFSQVENPLQERYRGTGLGLPLCRNLAMLLGGRMWLESETGRGLDVLCRIPAGLHRRIVARRSDTTMPAGPGVPSSAGSVPGRSRGNGAPVGGVFAEFRVSANLAPTLPRRKSGSPAYACDRGCRMCVRSRQSWGFVARLRKNIPRLQVMVTGVLTISQPRSRKARALFLQKPIKREVLLARISTDDHPRQARAPSAHRGRQRGITLHSARSSGPALA